MSWIFTIAAAIVIFVVYTMIINREFIRCPHCRKIGSWRFDSIGDSIDEHDEDGCLIRSETPQRCRKCGGKVIHIWSDFEGQEIREHPDSSAI
jgi:hypothetical protein